MRSIRRVDQISGESNVYSGNLHSSGVVELSLWTVVKSIEFIVSSLNLNFDRQSLLLNKCFLSILGLLCLELGGFLLKSSKGILIKG